MSGLPDEPEIDGRATCPRIYNGERYRPASVAENVDRLEAGLRRAAYRRGAVRRSRPASMRRRRRWTWRWRSRRGRARSFATSSSRAATPASRPIARSIVLTPDAPLDPAAIGETRKRLYDLDVYRSVDIEVQPLAAAAPPLSNPRSCRPSSRSSPGSRSKNGRAIASATGWPSATRLSGPTNAIAGSASPPIWRTGTSSAAARPRASRCAFAAISRWAAHARVAALVRAAASLDRVHRTPARAAQSGRSVSDHVGHLRTHRRTGVSASPRHRAPLRLWHRAEPHVHPDG